MGDRLEKKYGRLSINAILNIIKQCCNILFPLITYPYVSRILGAANLGRFSFANSIVSYFTLFATLGVPTYAIREGARIRGDKKKIKEFAAEVFSINVIALLISYLGFVVVTICVDRFEEDRLLLYILSFNIICNVIGRDWINSIYEDYLYISMRYILFQALALIAIFLFIKEPDDYVAYTIIMLFANAGPYLVNLFYTKKYIPIRWTRKLNLKRHLKPVMYLFCISIALVIYINSDITILGFYRTDEEVGIYTLISKIYTILKGLLNAVIMVIIPRLSNYLGSGDTEKYNLLLNKLKEVLITIIFPCVVGVFIMSEEITLLIGGREYIAGTIALRLLCIAMIFAVFACFFAQAVLVTKRLEKYFFRATIISAVVNIVLNIILVPYGGINAAACTTVLAEFLVMMICRYHSKFLIANTKSKSVISSLVGCMGIIIACFVVKIFHLQLIVEVIVAIVISAAVYFVALLLLKNPIFIDAIKDIRKIRTMKEKE